jgi:HlyD family secretion protein
LKLIYRSIMVISVKSASRSVPDPASGETTVRDPISRRAASMFVPIGAMLAACFCPALAGETGPDPLSAMAVTVVRATKTCFPDTVRVNGTLVAREEAPVRPERESEGLHIAEVLVDDGDSVSTGQVLARLTRREGQAGPTAANIEAPAAGIISRSNARIGALASVAAEPLFHIIVGGEFELDAEVPLVRLSKLAPGQVAHVQVAAVGELVGHVRLVSPQVSATTQMGRVRIAIDKGEKLQAGTFAQATVDGGTSCNASVPLSAVLYGSDGPVVQVVRQDRIETKPVRIGLISGENTEIREGLDEGDVVVVRAGSFLREDDRVRPVPVEGTGGPQ